MGLKDFITDVRNMIDDVHTKVLRIIHLRKYLPYLIAI